MNTNDNDNGWGVSITKSEGADSPGGMDDPADPFGVLKAAAVRAGELTLSKHPELQKTTILYRDMLGIEQAVTVKR